MTKQALQRMIAAFCVLSFFAVPLSAQEVRLQYKFKTGDVSRYKETTENDMTSDMMPAGGQKVFNEMYSTQRVEKVNNDGSAEVVQTIDSVNTLLNDQPFNNPQTTALVGLPVRITVAATGKMLDIRPISDSASESEKAAVEILRKQLATQPSYPATALALNVPWEDSVTFSQATQMGSITSNIRYSTKLVGEDTVASNDVKVLERSVTIAGEIGDGAGTLKGSGRGNIYFSDVLGKEIMSTMLLDESIAMDTPQGPFSMAMKVSTKKELLR